MINMKMTKINFSKNLKNTKAKREHTLEIMFGGGDLQLIMYLSIQKLLMMAKKKVGNIMITLLLNMMRQTKLQNN